MGERKSCQPPRQGGASAQSEEAAQAGKLPSWKLPGSCLQDPLHQGGRAAACRPSLKPPASDLPTQPLPCPPAVRLMSWLHRGLMGMRSRHQRCLGTVVSGRGSWGGKVSSTSRPLAGVWGPGKSKGVTGREGAGGCRRTDQAFTPFPSLRSWPCGRGLAGPGELCWPLHLVLTPCPSASQATNTAARLPSSVP